MDFGRIIAVFNDMKNNNLSATPKGYDPLPEEKLTVLQNLEKAKNFLRYDLTDAIISLESAMKDTDAIASSKIKDVITFIKRKDVLTAQNILDQLIQVCQLKQASDAMLGEVFNPPIERCQDCGNPTGYGHADDSLYTMAGDGPFCDKCFAKINKQLADYEDSWRRIFRVAP